MNDNPTDNDVSSNDDTQTDTQVERPNRLVTPPQWAVVKDFSSQISVEGYDFTYTLVIRVSKSEGFRPRYSVITGRYMGKEQNEQARISTHLPVFTRAHNAKVMLAKIHDALAGLLYEAQEFIREECQKREDEILEQRIAKEERDVERGKQKKAGGTHA